MDSIQREWKDLLQSIADAIYIQQQQQQQQCTDDSNDAVPLDLTLVEQKYKSLTLSIEHLQKKD